ncbi:MAG: hypothetical protein LBQ68_03875, partial [Clostridiales bacterium]|nr:hypothetical protein [Clostridiales bacterium]
DKGISEKRPGAYVFGGRKMDIPGVRETLNGGAQNSLAARYNLDDIFGKSEAFNTSAQVSRYAMAAAIARIAGAPRYTEPFEWIAQNMNLRLSDYETGNPISREEALVLLESLYSYRTRTAVPISKGILPAEDRTGMTVGELLEILREMDNKIGFY